MENNIQFVYGDMDFIAKSILQTGRKSQYRSQFCLHADDSSAIKSFIENSKEDIEPKMLILDNLQLLSDLNMRNLDFIFRLSDHHRQINNLDLYLVADKYFFSIGNENFSINESKYKPTDEITWRSYVSQRFNSKNNNFNGIAFSGRIQNFHIQDSMHMELEENGPVAVCDHLFERLGLQMGTNERTFMSIWRDSIALKFRGIIRSSDRFQLILAFALPFTFFYHLCCLWKRISCK